MTNIGKFMTDYKEYIREFRQIGMAAKKEQDSLAYDFATEHPVGPIIAVGAFYTAVAAISISIPLVIRLVNDKRLTKEFDFIEKVEVNKENEDEMEEVSSDE